MESEKVNQVLEGFTVQHAAMVRGSQERAVSLAPQNFVRMQTLSILEGAALALYPSQSSLFSEGKCFPHV